MFLSRVQINPARRGGRKLLGSPQAMHAAVLAAFPQGDKELGRVLWRVDSDAHQHLVYVVSRFEPDFAHIVEQAGWPTTQDGWVVRAYAPLLERLEAGQQWAFRLTANPSKAGRPDERRERRRHEAEGHESPPAQTSQAAGQDTGDEDTTPRVRSQRFGHVTVDQQRNWLLKRTAQWGFEIPERDGVPNVVVHDRRTDRFRRREGNVTIVKATYDGILTVTDADALRRALTAGLGRAKAYGCGLLTLAPSDPR